MPIHRQCHRSAVPFHFFLLGMILILFQPFLVEAAEKGKPVDLSTAIVRVAKQNLPKVVHIEVTESREVTNPFLPYENDPFFRRFFGNPKMPRKFKQEVKGLGSGMIIDVQDHILTNYHVARGATKLEVTLADGSKYPATLVGGDPKTDLAVIRIQPKEKLPHVTFGDSDKVEVGEWVVAIGAPRALEKSVTQGIISAKHRRGITDPTGYQDFLQTDAATNPDNSGGPADKAGMKMNDVVIAYRGKEIPDTSTLRNDVAETPIGTEAKLTILRNGKKEELTVKIGSLDASTKILAATVKDRLGVEVRSPNSTEVTKYGITPNQGVVITWEDPNGPLKEAGFEIGDMILAINNQPIESMESFVDLVSLLRPKQKIPILALDHRTGKTGMIQVVTR